MTCGILALLAVVAVGGFFAALVWVSMPVGRLFAEIDRAMPTVAENLDDPDR